MRGSLFAFFLLTAWLHCEGRSVISFQHFSQDPVMWEPHGRGQTRHHLPPITWMAMQCVPRHENVGRSGGGEAGGTGSRQCVKDKSYKYARTPCSSALPISCHHRDLQDQSYHLSSWLSSAGCSYSPIAWPCTMPRVWVTVQGILPATWLPRMAV